MDFVINIVVYTGMSGVTGKKTYFSPNGRTYVSNSVIGETIIEIVLQSYSLVI